MRKGYDFPVALKCNSKEYSVTNADEGMFKWRDSVVGYGHARYKTYFTYRFENLSHKNDELLDNINARKNGDLGIDKAGNFIILCSKKLDAEQVYRIYKKRCETEGLFDTAKNCLSTDKMYIHDNAHIIGHLFIAFVSPMIWLRIAELIET